MALDLANLLNEDIYLMDRVLLEDNAIDEVFGKHLKKVPNFYSTVKTLLYQNYSPILRTSMFPMT